MPVPMYIVYKYNILDWFPSHWNYILENNDFF